MSFPGDEALAPGPDTDRELPAHVTIATVAQRTGLSVHTLRAWERRYGIPVPLRSGSRYRLYGPADLDLLRRMQSFIAEGASPTEAARRARLSEQTVPAGSAEPEVLRTAMVDAMTRMDGETVQALLNRSLAAHGVLGLVDDIVVPVLREVGELWASGRIGVDVEHFATQAVRSRLGGIAAATPVGQGRRALLLCAPDELHDVALVTLSLRLLRAGWQTILLGANLPVADAVAAVGRQRPDLVCISVTFTANAAVALETAAVVRAAMGDHGRVLVGGQGLAAGTSLPAGVEGESALAAILRGDTSDPRGGAEPDRGATPAV